MMRTALLLAVLLAMACSPATQSRSQPTDPPPPRPTARPTFDRVQATARAVDEATRRIEILRSSEAVSKRGNFLSITGEVRNNGETAVLFVKILATVYGPESTVIATDTTYVRASGNALGPGQTAPFEVLTRFDDRIVTYRLQILL